MGWRYEVWGWTKLPNGEYENRLYCNTNYLIGAILAMFHTKKTCGLVTLKWR